MVTINNARVDMTFVGYLLIGLVLLILGVWGLQEGCLFGDSTGHTEYTKLPLDWNVVGQISGLAGLLLMVFSIFTYRTGKKTSTGVFTFFAVYFIYIYVNNATKSSLHLTNSSWFSFVAIAILFLIIAIYALVASAPKFVAVLLLLTALMSLFFGLSCFYGPFCSDNVDLHKTMGMIAGIIGLLGFIVATYLGLAYADQKRIPVI